MENGNDPAMKGPVDPARQRSLHMLFVVALGVSIVGFVAGTLGSPDEPRQLVPTSVETDGTFLDAVPYGELAEAGMSPNAQFRLELSSKSSSKPPKPRPARDSARNDALQQRAERRAFGGAPPTVPHPIDDSSTGACLVCHRDGVAFAGRVAPPMSHGELGSCPQCHVPGNPSAPSGDERTIELADNTFVGVPQGARGARAWPGAPPEIPHPVFMREECSSCHGELGKPGLRTSHPDRRQCLQCHAPTTNRDKP